MSLRYNLFAAFLLVAVIATVSAGYLGYTDSKASLESAISNHLTGLREAKAQQITTYFHGIESEVKMMGLSIATVEATKQFRDAYRQIDATKIDAATKSNVIQYYQEKYLPRLQTWLGTEPKLADYLPVSEAPFALQDRYIVKNPYPFGQKQLLDSSGVNDAYDAAHKMWHPRFRRMVEMADFYDLVLIDAETKREIYSVKKLPDFGTSLDAGPVPQHVARPGRRRLLRWQSGHGLHLLQGLHCLSRLRRRARRFCGHADLR